MRSKKIGLLTIHDTVNYGSLLQTYSTFLACKKLGANIKLIDYKCSAIEHREKPVAFKDCRSLHDLYRYFMFYKDLKKKYDNVHHFIVENMDCTHPFFKETISETNNLFDTFLVGSDIVWGTQITGNDYTYFLDFVDEKKRRLSFSSSVGTEWTEDEKQTIEPLLKKFERITVREQIAADWIEKLVSILQCCGEETSGWKCKIQNLYQKGNMFLYMQLIRIRVISQTGLSMLENMECLHILSISISL